MTKGLRENPRRPFLLIQLKFKFYQIHLVRHEVIGEVRVHSTNKTFGTIPHPSIYNVRSYVLHASGCKSMAQIILRHLFIFHYSLEHAIQGIQRTVTFNRFVDVDIFSSLFRNRDFLIYLVPISRLMLCV